MFCLFVYSYLFWKLTFGNKQTLLWVFMLTDWVANVIKINNDKMTSCFDVRSWT